MEGRRGERKKKGEGGRYGKREGQSMQIIQTEHTNSLWTFWLRFKELNPGQNSLRMTLKGDVWA